MLAAGFRSKSSCEGDRFATTHWGIVLAAGDNSSSRRQEALESLCHAYWQPLYSYIRRLGHTPPDAQDLTQSFLVSLLTHGSLTGVSPRKGRFRSFLLASLKYFLADEWDRVRAQKRGGDVSFISLDAQQAEQRYAMEPVDCNDPEKVFERRWALAVLERTLGRLEAEMARNGKEGLWAELRVCLLEEADAPSYRDLARRLGLSLSGVKMTVWRLRQRYGELLRAEIADTVSSEREVDEEMRHLLAAVKG